MSACGAWNWMHECTLPFGHAGDHRCGGCGDVWNRGEWDDDADESDRPDERCTDVCGGCYGTGYDGSGQVCACSD